MGLESATYVSGLVEANPTTTDALGQGDDHIRLLKAVLKSSFPTITGPLNALLVPFTPAGGIAATTVGGALSELGIGKYTLGTNLGTPSAGNLLNCTFPTLNQNTTGTAANLSGTPTLPNGVTAVTQSPGDNSTKLATTAFVAAFSSVPTGSVMPFAMATAPTGWLKANGAAVSRTTYAALFAAIGTTFGAGDGSTTFNVPEMRGEFVRGFDDGRGVDTGRGLGTAQADDLKSHTHVGLVNSGQLGTGGGSNYLGQPNNVGATGGVETRPRNIALLYCIKT